MTISYSDGFDNLLEDFGRLSRRKVSGGPDMLREQDQSELTELIDTTADVARDRAGGRAMVAGRQEASTKRKKMSKDEVWEVIATKWLALVFKHPDVYRSMIKTAAGRLDPRDFFNFGTWLRSNYAMVDRVADKISPGEAAAMLRKMAARGGEETFGDRDAAPVEPKGSSASSESSEWPYEESSEVVTEGIGRRSLSFRSR